MRRVVLGRRGWTEQGEASGGVKARCITHDDVGVRVRAEGRQGRAGMGGACICSTAPSTAASASSEMTLIWDSAAVIAAWSETGRIGPFDLHDLIFSVWALM